MSKKGLGVIIALTVVSTVTYFVTKKYLKNRKKKKVEEYLKLKLEGDRYFSDKLYETAVLFYIKCVSYVDLDSELVELYNNIACCYIKLKDMREALLFLDKSINISIVDNKKALKWRCECFKILNMKKEYLRDLLLYGVITKDDKYKKQAEDTITAITKEETDKYMETSNLKPSVILYNSFFDTFHSLFHDSRFSDNELLQFIKKNEYVQLESILFTNSDGKSSIKNRKMLSVKSNSLEDLTKFEKEKDLKEDINVERDTNSCNLENSSLEDSKSGDLPAQDEENNLVNLLKACYYFIKGKKNEAIKVLENDDFLYSKIFCEYIKSIKKDYKINENELEIETNEVTLLFYIAKIYLNMKNKEKYKFYTKKAMDIEICPFIYADILLSCINEENYLEFEKVAKEALQKKKNDINILTICGEYYLKKGDRREVEHIMVYLDRYFPDDPRNLIFKSVYFSQLNENTKAEEILRVSLAKDVDFYKSYIYLGNLLLDINDEEAKELFKISLQKACCYDEVFISTQALFLLEIQTYIKNKINFN